MCYTAVLHVPYSFYMCYTAFLYVLYSILYVLYGEDRFNLLPGRGGRTPVRPAADPCFMCVTRLLHICYTAVAYVLHRFNLCYKAFLYVLCSDLYVLKSEVSFNQLQGRGVRTPVRPAADPCHPCI